MRVIGGYRPEFEASFNALARELGVDERVSLDGWLRSMNCWRAHRRVSPGSRCTSRSSKGLEYVASASNKLFEYAAMGLPVIVPDRENYRDFLGDAEWVTYADIEQPESIARAITSIFADRERYVAMSRAARRAFEDQYNYERVFAPALERICALADGVLRAPQMIADAGQSAIVMELTQGKTRLPGARGWASRCGCNRESVHTAARRGICGCWAASN